MSRKFTFAFFSKSLFCFCFVTVFLYSCVDKDYDIDSMDDISKEITIASDGIEAPILQKSRKTIESLIGDDADDYLSVGEDGVYVLGYGDSISATIDDLKIDPITDFVPEITPHVVRLSEDDIQLPAEVHMNAVMSSFDVNIPNFDIERMTEIPEVSSSSSVKLPDGLLAGTVINPQSTPTLTLTVEDYSEISVNALLPDEVSYVSRVEFGSTDDGSLVTMSLDIANLADVYGGGTVKQLVVTYPAGYELGLANTYDGKASVSKGAASQTNNIFILSDYSFAVSQPLQVELYMKWVDLTAACVSDGSLVVDDTIQYDLEFALNTKAGTIGSGKNPELSIHIQPEFRDALVVSKDFSFEVSNLERDFSYDVTGVSPDIKTVSYIALQGDNKFTLKASDLNLPFVDADFDVNVALPEILNFEPSQYISAGNILTVPFSVLKQGLDLDLKSINFGNTGKGEVSNGTIPIRETLRINIEHTFPSATYRLSEVVPAMGTQTCSIEISDLDLFIDRVSCVFVLNSISSDVDATEQFTYDMELPKEIKSIDRLYIETTDGDNVIAEVKFRIDDSPVDKVYIDNFVMTLPDFFCISGDDVKYDNTIEISRREIQAQTGGEVFLTAFEISGLKNVPVEDGHMNIDEVISLKGTVRTIEGEIIEGLNSDITVTPMLSIPDISVVKFEGKVDVDINDYIDAPSIDLGDITDELSDISLGVVNPNLTVAVSNPVGIAFLGNIILHPFDKNGNPMTDVVIGDVRIEGADENGNAVTKLYITPLEGSSKPGYDTYYTPGLLDLIHNLPSKIDLDLQVSLDDSQTHSLWLDRDYLLDVAYDFNVPLRLDETTLIHYQDDIDLEDAFEDVSGKGIRVESLKVILKAKSDIPLALTLVADFRDQDGNTVDGVDFQIKGTVAGYNPATDGDAKVSELSAEVKLRDGDVDLLKSVRQLHLDVSGTSSSDIGLRPEQYIEVSGYVQARRISADLDKF